MEEEVEDEGRRGGGGVRGGEEEKVNPRSAVHVGQKGGSSGRL